MTSLPRLKMCKSCTEVAISYDGLCKNCTPSKGIRNYTDNPTPQKNMLNPFGVEMEVINTCPQNSLNKVAEYVCSDSSVSDEGGAEIKLCADASKMGDFAADTAQRAKLAGGKITKSCGLHIHMSNPIRYTTFNGRKVYEILDEGNLKTIYPYLKGIEDFMFSIMPNSRRDNHYCRALTDYRSLANHHSWVARGARTPTLEIRIHPGSLNPWKVKGWVDTCKKIQTAIHSVLKECPSNAAIDIKEGRFLEIFPKNSLAFKYVNARLEAKGSLKKFGFNEV